MTKDRLKEFRERAHISDQDGEGDASQTNDDSSVIISIEMQGRDGLDRFFEQVEDLRSLIYELQEDVKNVKIHHNDILARPIPNERKKQELDELMSIIKTDSQVIYSKLKDIERSIHEEESQIENDRTPASLRIRRNQYSYLLREFVQVVNEYQKAQIDYRDKCKGRIKRQLNITGTSFTDDDVEKMIEKGDFSVFSEGGILAEAQAKQRLIDVEDRHNDILKLEENLRELHDLFMEMAMLVENQGEVVDRIENQVQSAVEYTEKAKEHLIVAQKWQRKAKKKQIWIIIICIIFVIVLAILIYFSIP